MIKRIIRNLFYFIDEILKGVSQILLQENRWSGLLFLLGMLIGNWRYPVAAILAVITGTLTARVLKFDKDSIKAGLYGYNPALVGVTLNYLFESTLLVWILVLAVGGVLTVLFQHFLEKKDLTTFTLPYILTIWLLYVILEYIFKLDHSSIIQTTFSIANEKYGNYLAVISGYGEVIFQKNLAASLLIFLGVYIGKPIKALYGLIASLLATLISQMFSESIDQIYTGLYGFNAVLTALALSGMRRIDGFWVLLGTIITVHIDILLVHAGFLQYVGGAFTFPFVAGTLITLWLKEKASSFRLRTPEATS